MENKDFSISVIIPAYNEEKNIECAVSRTIKTFEEMGFNYELIIINDGSIDRTGEIAAELAGRYSNVSVWEHEKNLGSASAFRTGIAHAQKDYLIFVPIDNPLEKEDIEAYLPRIAFCDIVVGSRIERVGYNRFARFASFMYNRIFIPVLFNIGIGDVNWIQIYRRNLFSDSVISFNSKSIFWLVEILIRAKKKRLVIAEVPAKMKKRMYGRATCTRFSVILYTFLEMLRFFFALRKEEKK